jgi:hypothetical protein
MKLLIDFDDTLHDTMDRRPGHRMGRPEPGSLMAVRYLHQMGHEIIVFTGRRVDKPNVYQTVKDWLDYFGFPYHEITNIKPDSYDLIIDNRAIHYDSWERVLVMVHRLRDPEKEKEFVDESTASLDTNKL